MSSRPSAVRTIRSAAWAAPTAAGTAEAVKRKARLWTRRNSMTSAGPARKPPQLASDFENVPMRRSTRSSTPKCSDAPGAARAEHAGAVGLVDHQARAEALAQVADLGQRRDVALHREDAVDHDEDAAAVVGGALEHALELVHAVVAEGAQLGAAEQAAVEDRRVVAGVGDDGVGGAEDRPQRADVGLVAGGEDDRVLGPLPVGDLLLELEVQRRGAVEQARARSGPCRSARARRARPG